MIANELKHWPGSWFLMILVSSSFRWVSILEHKFNYFHFSHFRFSTWLPNFGNDWGMECTFSFLSLNSQLTTYLHEFMHKNLFQHERGSVLKSKRWHSRIWFLTFYTPFQSDFRRFSLFSDQPDYPLFIYFSIIWKSILRRFQGCHIS